MIYLVIKETISGCCKQILKAFKHHDDAIAYINSCNPGTQYVYRIQEITLC